MQILRLVFLTFFLILASLWFADSLPTCGFVFDGSKPLVDIDAQSSISVIRANWYGFDGDNIPVTTTTGSSTGSTVSSTGSSTGHSKGSSTKRTLRGINAAQAGSTTGHSKGTTTGGSTGGTTGGTGGTVFYEVAIISEKEALTPILESGWNASSSHRCRSTPGNFKTPDVQDFTPVFPAVVQGSNGATVYQFTSGELTLVSKVHYYVIVKAIFGEKSVYSNSNGVQVGVEGSSSSSNNGFPAYKAGLIAMGIAIYCLLLLLLLLVLVAKGKGEDKYTTTVTRNENVDKL